VTQKIFQSMVLSLHGDIHAPRCTYRGNVWGAVRTTQLGQLHQFLFLWVGWKTHRQSHLSFWAERISPV